MNGGVLAGLSYLAHAGYQVEFAYRTGEAMVVLMRSGKIKKKFGGRTLDEAVRKAVRYVLEMRRNESRRFFNTCGYFDKCYGWDSLNED